jgi:hypothetical protein
MAVERDGIVMHAAEAESGGTMAAAAFPRTRRSTPHARVGGAHTSHVDSGAVHLDKQLRPEHHKIVQVTEGTMESPVCL